MTYGNVDARNYRGKDKAGSLSTLLLSGLIFVLFSMYGCGNKTAAPPAQTAKPQGVITTAQAPVPQPDSSIEETVTQEGYIYDQRDRRDPFVPLIVPKKSVQKRDGSKAGTLEDYDLSEFVLSAIARKGRTFFALLITPDNRSFTVRKGTVIGLSKGKVKKITKDTLMLVEYSRDYRGEIKPRQIMLELHKGEVE